MGAARETRLLEDIEAEDASQRQTASISSPSSAEPSTSTIPQTASDLPLLSTLSIQENHSDADALPPTPSQPDFEAPSQKPPPSASRFILNRKMQQKASSTPSPTKPSPVIATPKTEVKAKEEEVIPVAYPEESDSVNANVEEDYEDESFREIMYAALGLREELREKGELD